MMVMLWVSRTLQNFAVTAATAAVRMAVIQRASMIAVTAPVILSFITMTPHVTGNPFFRFSGYPAIHLSPWMSCFPPM